jgi:peptide-methionine (S)-S-oxide reductase
MAKTAAVLGLALLAVAGSSGPAPAASPAPAPAAGLAKATFAGGCFWCMEGPFDKVPGVVSTTSGYTGGSVPRPSYEMVSSGTTGHAESVEVVYDPKKVSYSQLLDVYWHNVDPTDAGGQFCDRGNQYRTAIFYRGDEERRLAEQSKKDIEASGKLKKPIVTEVVPAGEFYPAEDYHQDYYIKNPVRYRYYRFNCGRDARLKDLWGQAPAH